MLWNLPASLINILVGWSTPASGYTTFTVDGKSPIFHDPLALKAAYNHRQPACIFYYQDPQKYSRSFCCPEFSQRCMHVLVYSKQPGFCCKLVKFFTICWTNNQHLSHWLNIQKGSWQAQIFLMFLQHCHLNSTHLYQHLTRTGCNNSNPPPSVPFWESLQLVKTNVT